MAVRLLFQPFLRFYPELHRTQQHHARLYVSTLLEILLGTLRPDQVARSAHLVSTLLEILHDATRRGGNTLSHSSIVVSTLLEILPESPR